MNPFHAAALCFAIVAVPANAGSLSDTHKMHWAPTGKVPAMTFHPLKRTCGQAATSLHLAGKMPLRAATGNRPCTKIAGEEAYNAQPLDPAKRSVSEG